MRALVVIADSAPEGVVRAAADRAVGALARAGHHVDVVDLHAVGFRSAMSLEERLAYESEEPILDSLVATHAHLLREAEILVFAYPTWWDGLPAILKGWLERTMVPGVGFTFHPETGKVRPGLPQVRRIVGITHWAAPRRPVIGRLLPHADDDGRRILTRALRMSCGWRARPIWLRLDGDADEPVAFFDRIERRLARV